MRYQFKLPDVGEGTAEAEVVAWYASVGDRVAEDQHLVDVMTDKVTVEITAPVSGTVVALMAKTGDMATVGAVLVEFEIEDGAAMVPDMPPAVVAESLPCAPDPGGALPGKVLAAPAVRQRAADLAIALERIAGTGSEGRITHGDLDRFLTAGAAVRPAVTTDIAVDGTPIAGLRRRIAERMAEAKRTIPHFAYVEEIDMTALEDLRARLNGERKEGAVKLTVLPFLMRAVVQALSDFPQINAHFDGAVLRRYEAVHIGIATDTKTGLMVPVVKHAEGLGLSALAEEITRLAERARNAKASKDELTGSTITITSLGALGGIIATPIINMPEVAIIAPNAIRPRPVARDGQIVIRKMMNLSSCYDHRVIDGATAAAFVQRIKALLEQPEILANP